LIPYKNISKEIFILLFIPVVTAFLINSFSPSGISLVGEWDALQCSIGHNSEQDDSENKPVIYEVLTAKKIYDGGEAIFVDARDPELYRDGHIKGSVSLPVRQFDRLIDKFKEEYPIPATPIVVYSSANPSEDIHELAQYLFENGYTNVKVFVGGYEDWKREGYPIE
jgi:rhodanese-related sulfurtransferase